MAARFTETDIKRAIRGARAAGLHIASIEIDPSGKIVIASQTTKPTPRKALDARYVVMERIARMGNDRGTASPPRIQRDEAAD